MTDLQGEQISRLGAHFDPLVVAARPALVAVAEPEMLLVVQASAVAVGAVPVFLLARKHLGTDWAGLGFALVYLLYPPTQWLVVDDFHPVAFATPLLLGGDLVPRRGSPRCRSPSARRRLPDARSRSGSPWRCSVSGTAVAHGRRRAGAVIGGGGVARRPRRDDRDRSPLRARRRFAVRGTLRRSRRVARPEWYVPFCTDPLRRAGAADEHRDLSYLLSCSCRSAGLPLLSPLLAASALPGARSSTSSPRPAPRRRSTSTTRRRRSPGSSRRRCSEPLGSSAAPPGRTPLLLRALVVLVLVSGVVLGPLPFWRHVPSARPRDARPRRQPLTTARPHACSRRCLPGSPSAPRTRSARISPSGGASSASRCSARRAGSQST